MGLKEFWEKLTGGDAAEQEIEEIRDNPERCRRRSRTTRA